MPDELVTVARFYYYAEAYLWKAKLESEGIWSFIADEHILTTQWLYSLAVGGIKLKVRQFDAAEATRIIQGAQKRDLAAFAPDLRRNIQPVPETGPYQWFKMFALYLLLLLSYISGGI